MSITMMKAVSYNPTYVEEQFTDYVNSTLWIRPETWQIMSDEWDTLNTATSISEGGSLVRTCVGSNINSVVIDANDEAFQRFWKRVYEDRVRTRTADAERNAAIIRKGDTVHVYKGRNGQGTVGKVVVIINGSYGMGYRSQPMYKYGIATSDRMGPVVAKNGKTYNNYLDVVWAWECNVELVGNPHPVSDEERLTIENDSRRQADFETKNLRAEFARYNEHNKKVA